MSPSSVAKLGATTLIIYFVVMVAGIIGWVLNLVKIFGSDFSDITGLLVLRIIGAFVAPLGAVLGYIG